MEEESTVTYGMAQLLVLRGANRSHGLGLLLISKLFGDSDPRSGLSVSEGNRHGAVSEASKGRVAK